MVVKLNGLPWSHVTPAKEIHTFNEFINPGFPESFTDFFVDADSQSHYLLTKIPVIGEQLYQIPSWIAELL